MTMEIGINLLCCFVLSIVLTSSVLTQVHVCVDACNISHSNITSEPLFLTNSNLTDEFNGCELHLTLSEGYGTSIEILHSNVDNAYSNFFIEILGTSDSNEECRHNIISIPLNSKPCALILSNAVLSFKLHYFNTRVQLKIQGIHSDNPKIEGCYVAEEKLVENGVVNISCNTAQYKNVNAGYRYKSYETFYRFECRLECTCTLSYKKLTTICNDDVIVSLLVYHPDTAYLRFDYQNLTEITSNAFEGLNGLTGIELIGNRLSTLPVKLFSSLTSLERLQISRNNLRVLPVGVFAGLTELSIIYLEYNIQQLTLKPGVFGGLTELRSLPMTNNQLVDLPHSVFDGLTNLVKLNLAFNSISSLPAHLFRDLLNLRILVLNFNLISLVDVYLGSLGLLQELKLQDNLLSELTANVFTGLTRMRVIILSYNRLSSFPVSIFDNLTSAEIMDLQSNKLIELPTGIFKGLVTLNKVYLQNNLLTSISDKSFDGLVKLNTLEIHNNRLISLQSDAFKDMHSLFNVDISYNSLSILPDNIFDAFVRVASLFLNDNKLGTLPENIFDNMTSLTFLHISNNNFTYLHPNLFISFDQLTYLNISYNKLQDLPSLKPLLNLQILDLTSNKLRYMTKDMFINIPTLKFLSLDDNEIPELPIGIFDGLPRLQILYLRNNLLTEIKLGLFGGLNQVILLKLSINRLSIIDAGAFRGLIYLQKLDMQYNDIVNLPIGIFDNLTSLQTVNLSHNLLQRIESEGAYTNAINILDLRSNDLFLVTKTSFEGVTESTIILVDESATCCFVKYAKCIPRNPRPVYLTCQRMVDDLLPRVSIWVLGVFAVVCNVYVFYLRCVDKQDKSVQSLLISHLALSDLLMGINMVLLASADAYYTDYFPSYSEFWRKGPICKFTSTLSILSSEVSVILITLITFDRFQGVEYPFSFHRLRPKSSKICLTSIWIIGIVISVLPVVLSGLISDVYEVSEVCVGIPIVRRPVSVTNISSVEIESRDARLYKFFFWNSHVGGIVTDYRMGIQVIYISIAYATSYISSTKLATYFSITVFIGLNLVCFLLVAIFYIQIFKTARDTTKRAGRKQTEKEEIRMAIKMSAIVLTDFLTWVPIVIVCILVQCQLIIIDPLVYVWTVAFIIPINSAINPFLYTLITIIQNRKQTEKVNVPVISSTTDGVPSKP